MNVDFEGLGQAAVAIAILALAMLIFAMVGLLWLGWWASARRGSPSPYTRKPMGLGEDLAFGAVRAIAEFLQRFDPSDNPVFDIKRAALCRQTGRIFPDCVNNIGIVKLDWNFLVRRCPGRWTSWGSLGPELQKELRDWHDSLEGFQTEVSSPNPSPKDIDLYHAMTRPGPLYVDLASKTLMGWKRVPGTELEVLVVQRPYYRPYA